MNPQTPESSDNQAAAVVVLTLLVGSGYATFFYTGSIWSFFVWFQFAAAAIILLLVHDAARHNDIKKDCAKKDKDGAHALAQATTLGTLAQAGMLTMSVCLATLAPEERTRASTLAYGMLAALAPSVCYIIRLLGHYSYYAGLDRANSEDSAEVGVSSPLVPKQQQRQFDAGALANILAAVSFVAFGYTSLFLPEHMFWLTLLLAAIWLTPVMSAVFQCDFRTSCVFGPFASFWKAIGGALLLQIFLASLSCGLNATGRLEPVSERGPALMCYSMIAALLPFSGFVALRVHQALFLAGLAQS